MLSVSGRQESFAGLFTPQLILGDEVHIGEEIIGTVTDVTHSFGKGGFFTTFTVDSGGRKARARLSDMISKASNTTNTSGVEIF